MRSAPRTLAFVIHDMNTWGGQDRSTLEIATRLARRWPVEVHAFSLEGAGEAPLRFRPVQFGAVRPVIVRETYFHAMSAARLGADRMGLASRKPPPLVHSTGTCSLISDVVHVQFIHTAWQEAWRTACLHGEGCSALEAEFKGSDTALGHVKSLYRRCLLEHETRLERALFTDRKRYVAISDGVAADLDRIFGVGDRVTVIRHGVDSGRFRPAADRDERASVRRELGLGDREIVILLVGSYARKGLETAIGAMARLDGDDLARAQLVAVGAGDRERFHELATSLGVTGHVTLIEHTHDVIPYYRAADVFVLPTVYEPFGLVVLEAMACGLPCVVSACSGAAELARNGESAILLDDPLDTDELSAKLGRLIADEPLRTRLGRAARAVAEARTWDHVADEYSYFLEPMLGSRASEAGE